jgi:PemK-like, MazF-like toxin of type II toxin-antitoxin system
MLAPQIESPGVGEIIYYRFLWAKEAKEGYEPRYPRPCVVLDVKPLGDQRYEVLVLPVTSEPQHDSRHVKVPLALNEMAGLDPDKEHCVVNGEANVFMWPSWDVIAIRTRDYSGLIRGTFPEGFVRGLKAMWQATREKNQTVTVDREKLAREAIADYRRRRDQRAYDEER